MKRNKLFLGLMLSIGAATVAIPAQARVILDVDVAPPAPQVEVVPAPRAGYVWAPGYYNWDGHQHVWVGGHWIHERHGQHWVADRWDQRDGHYHHEAGHWEHG